MEAVFRVRSLSWLGVYVRHVVVCEYVSILPHSHHMGGIREVGSIPVDGIPTPTQMVDFGGRDGDVWGHRDVPFGV